METLTYEDCINVNIFFCVADLSTVRPVLLYKMNPRFLIREFNSTVVQL